MEWTLWLKTYASGFRVAKFVRVANAELALGIMFQDGLDTQALETSISIAPSFWIRSPFRPI